MKPLPSRGHAKGTPGTRTLTSCRVYCSLNMKPWPQNARRSDAPHSPEYSTTMHGDALVRVRQFRLSFMLPLSHCTATQLSTMLPRFNESADAGERIVAPVLRATGVARLDAMIVSHQDSDHSGGALSLLQTVPVTWLTSSLPADNAIVRARAGSDESAERCVAGRRWQWDGVDFALLHPVEANFVNPKLKANDLSCVLRVSSPAGSALLTGDIEARTEADLIRRNAAALQANLLVVPHHGSRTSSTPAFIAVVAPEVAVFTPGYRNRFGHPRPEIVARYADAGIRTYRTDYDGALTFAFETGAMLGARRERDVDHRYWHDAPRRGELRPLD